jgi:hypothetical protein
MLVQESMNVEDPDSVIETTFNGDDSSLGCSSDDSYLSSSSDASSQYTGDGTVDDTTHGNSQASGE